ncbi:MAG TPA: aldehyde dehydrogenase family protein [Acidobacteriota bacterium]|nr:aldehyde dehydrogenase family protein [Acidobacteriota bacterium]
MRPVLIGGEWRHAASKGSFRAVDPATGAPLPDEYPISGIEDLEAALRAAARVIDENPALDPDRLAGFLDGFAAGLEARRDEAVALAHSETALPEEPRLRSVEFPRMMDQLRQAAAACRKRDWCLATIDAKRDIRSMYGPLGGPVVVFGPNNFPFAYNSVAGGDFAASIAAGNPVIAKANPGHPGTTMVLAEVAFEALRESTLPPALVQMVYHCRPEDGLKLAAHPLTGALAFTGSRASGLALKEAADRAGKPVYLEMSSVNPVLVLPGALEERSERLAEQLFGSCTSGAGQFCTKPGLVVLTRGVRSEDFCDSVRRLFDGEPEGFLLGEGTLRRLAEAVAALERAGAILHAGGHPFPGPGFRFANTLFRITGRQFLGDPAAFQTEAFGSLTVLVVADDPEELAAIVHAFEGNLTGTICSGPGDADRELHDLIEPILRRKVGRLLDDKMPTGVAVSPAMNHGGPFPATGHPGFTAVGFPASIRRFAALRCYDNVRPDRLPPELRDINPTGGMWRYIDGEWTSKSI